MKSGLINVGPYLPRVRKMCALLLLKHELAELKRTANARDKARLTGLLDLIKSI